MPRKPAKQYHCKFGCRGAKGTFAHTWEVAQHVNRFHPEQSRRALTGIPSPVPVLVRTGEPQSPSIEKGIGYTFGKIQSMAEAAAVHFDVPYSAVAMRLAGMFEDSARATVETVTVQAPYRVTAASRGAQKQAA